MVLLPTWTGWVEVSVLLVLCVGRLLMDGGCSLCCAVHDCRLSISDTLSDEEEPDKETEELRRQFVQELILSTLCLSDERSDSEAT